MRKIFVSILTACIIMLAAQTSHALILTSGFSENLLGDFTGSFNYSFVDATTGEIVVNLKNTSPIGNGGLLTAFAFNNPGNAITGITFGTTDAAFGVIGAPFTTNAIMGSPFGDFDIGASVTSTWLGTGAPTSGLAVNESGIFTFSLTGVGLDELTTESFFSAAALSNEPAGAQGVQNFVVRFRGFEDGGSDKIVGVPSNPIPEPASMFLFGTGLAGAFLRRKFQA